MAIIYGNNNANTLTGTAYDDYIYGYGGNDTLNGLDGDDFLDGGTGNDTMYGGAGDDSYFVDSTSDIVSEVTGEGYQDTVYATVNYTLSANVEHLFLYGTATTGKGNALINVIDGNSNDNYLYGYDGNDFLYGDEGNDYLNGGDGDDYMSGGTGNDIYVIDNQHDYVYEDANAGTDTVYAYGICALNANVENLYLYGTADTGIGNMLDNVIIGNSNSNYLDGNEGNDTLYGYDGDDDLFGGTGNDKLYGGTGNDTYIIDSTSDVVSEDVSAGNDTVYTYVDNYTLGANVEDLYMNGTATTGKGNALNNLIYGNSNANFLYGDAGYDRLIGLGGNDTLNGGAGNDYMKGGGGNDTYYVDNASDVAFEYYDMGTDRVNAYINYTLKANVENLYLYGTATNGYGNALNNTIIGNSNNNYLYGYEGNDTLNGGSGADTMLGGSGNDVYYVDNTGDKVYETTSTTSATDAGGVDTVYSYLTAYTLGSYVENGRILSTGAANLTGNSLNNILYAGAGNNAINGGTGTDTASYAYAGSAVTVKLALTTAQATGGSGADTLASIENLIGSNYNDNLYGNNGNNTIYGGSGNDYMAGGAGNDSLNGGAGQDRFVFAESGSVNRDILSGFSHTDDTIVLRDILDGSANSAITGLSFTGGVLDVGKYVEGTGKTGGGLTDAGGIYNNTTTGDIWYNPTSSTAGDSVLICTVGSTAAASLDNTDFVYSA
jgi:Ca2+-binding RTX toxin-like protein